MKQYFQFICVSLITINCQVKAIEFDAIVKTGLDSNPLKLSDELNITEENFLFAGFYSKSNWEELLYWQVHSEKAVYFNDARIDWFDSAIDLKLASDVHLMQVPFEYEVGVQYKTHDETYINQQTGRVATFNNNSIADRFDNEQKNYYVGLSYAVNNDAEFFLKYHHQNSHFKNFNLTGLDNLDHKQKKTTLGIQFFPREEAHFFLNLNYNLRNYVDRRDRNLLGVLIDSTDLSFNHYSIDLGYTHQPSDTNRWQYVFSYINRTTNGTHYYDSQRGKIEIKGDFNLADYHLLSAQLDYQTFFYDENLQHPVIFFEQNDIERRGATLKVEYTWVLATLFSTNLSFYSYLSATEFDSPNEFYQYARYQAAIGVRWSLN